MEWGNESRRSLRKVLEGSLWLTMTQSDSEWLLQVTPLGFQPIRAWFVRNESPIGLMWFSTAWWSHVPMTHQDVPDLVESLRLYRQMTRFFQLRGWVWRSQLAGVVGACGCIVPRISNERERPVGVWNRKSETELWNHVCPQLCSTEKRWIEWSKPRKNRQKS
jgi:hypothetical protein